jgi:hypothetical protein
MTTRACLVLLSEVLLLSWPAFAQLHPRNHQSSERGEPDVQAKIKNHPAPPARAERNDGVHVVYTRHGVISTDAWDSSNHDFGWNYSATTGVHACDAPAAQNEKNGCPRSLWDRLEGRWSERTRKKEHQPSVIYKDPAVERN